MIVLESGREPIPGFCLLEFLGKGQFGEVWLAEGHGRKKVALKFLDVQGASGFKEFKAISWIKEIQHPNLLPITGAWLLDHRGTVMDSALLDDPLQLEHGSHGNRPTMLVVAMVAGDKSLAQVYRDYVNKGVDRFPAVELLTYLDDAARGLDFLSSPRHDLGEGKLVAIQHRDVKPENILLIGDVAVVCDFGVARTMDATALTATGMIGSPAFMAPECIEGKQTSLTTDQYSLALTYYFLRTGAMPFPENATAMTALNCHMTGNLDLSCVSNEELHVLKQATHLDPRSRFESCRAMVHALRRATSNTDVPPPAVALLGSSSTPVRASEELSARSESIPRPNQTLTAEGAEEHGVMRDDHRGGPQIEDGLSDTDGSALTMDTVPARDGDSKRQMLRSAISVTAVCLITLLAVYNIPWAYSSTSFSSVPSFSSVAGQVRVAMVWCPPGSFTMGSRTEGGQDDNDNQVQVTLTRGFWLGKYEVTQAEWWKVMASEPWKGKDYVREGAAYPASYVSWEDARAFCDKLTKSERASGRLRRDEEYRLPTEAEWEYACRAGSSTAYSFGNDVSQLSDYAWWGRHGDGNAKNEHNAHEIGGKRANSWGLYDMHGNLWEWCADHYLYNETLPGGPDPIVTTGGWERVIRGGGWSSDPQFCRSADRDKYQPEFRSHNLGFRVLRSYVR